MNYCVVGKMNRKAVEQLQRLREAAEGILNEKPSSEADFSTYDLDALIHEIQVYQVELEIQNEQLRATQEELKKNRDQFYHLYHHAPLSYILVDEDGVIFQVNETFARLVGMDAVALKWKPLVHFMHPADQNLFLSRYRTFFKNPVNKELELRLLNSERQVQYFTLTGEPAEKCVPELSASKPLILLILTDITEIRESQKERERLLSAIQQLQELIVITDTDAKIEYVNPSFEETTGYSFAEVVGRKPNILKSGKHDEAFYQEMWKTITQGETWSGRMVNKKKDGSLFTEDVTITPVRDAQGKIINYVGVKRDVTDQMRLEEQLHHAQKMDSIGRLAGGVAHDFNNLLTGIIGYSQMARDSLEPDHPLHTMMNEIYKSGERAANLTQQLLAFSRKQIIQPQILNVNETLLGWEKMLRRTLGETIDIAVYPLSGSAPVKADPGQLDQIILNLAVNARDAMPEGGRLSIRIFETEMQPEPDYPSAPGDAPKISYVAIQVSDTGHGMPNDVQAKMFEPFFTTKEQGKGTGLGLSTVYGIVKQNQGWIDVGSDLGRGTVITVFLPRYDISRQSTTQTGDDKDTLTGGDETVLLLEDEKTVRDYIQMVLTYYGYQVIDAATPNEAEALFYEENNDIDLLITDVVLPQRDGKMIADQFCQSQPDLKVLFISGYSEDSISKHRIVDEGLHLLQKPFTKEDLLAKVREVMSPQQESR